MEKEILVIDNYDSFVYNLVHIIRELGYTPVVFRNDKISLSDVNHYDKILLSPGPGVPKDAGIMPELIKKYAPTKNIFGVCLGHQAIGEAFGAKLINLPKVLHGIASQTQVMDSEEILFKGLPSSFKVAHYHSWIVEESSARLKLKVSARDEKGNVMALRHPVFKVRGVQFHPESVLTEHGTLMLKNWLES